MGNDNFNPDEIYIVAEEWDIESSNINTQIDMHGYPVFQSVQQAENDLFEISLRDQHPELQKAYKDYQILLEKYGFWDKITK